MENRTTEELEQALPELLGSPTDDGELVMVVRRPSKDERELLERGQLSVKEGLIGDTWSARPSSRTADGSPHPDMQLNLMNSRILEFIAYGDRDRMALAGDQLIVDLDLSQQNLPPGTKLTIGQAIIEVTDQPHTGCEKFSRRFGSEARRFLNRKTNEDDHLRGINAKVVTPGSVALGDRVQVTRS